MKLSVFLTLLTVSCAYSLRLGRKREFFEVFRRDDESVSSGPTPSIDFTADWKETVHGKLGVGKDVQLNYDGARLSGPPVYAQYKFNDGPDFETTDLGQPKEIDGKKIYQRKIFIPPTAKKLVIWFKNDENEYDSDFGNNYSFDITEPSIVFDAEWNEDVHGKLIPGDSFDLFYDSNRLKKGEQVIAQMKFKDDEVVSKPLDIDDDSEWETAVISIPADAEKLEMWFYYTKADGKKQYDSDYGNNYHFPLSTE